MLRSKLGNALNLVRFHMMSLKDIDFLLKLLKQDDDQEIFTIFQFSIDQDVDKRVMEKCRSMIPEYIRCLHNSRPEIWKDFCKISQKCLMVLLADNCLYVEEWRLLSAVCFFLLLIKNY